MLVTKSNISVCYKNSLLPKKEIKRQRPYKVPSALFPSAALSDIYWEHTKRNGSGHRSVLSVFYSYLRLFDLRHHRERLNFLLAEQSASDRRRAAAAGPDCRRAALDSRWAGVPAGCGAPATMHVWAAAALLDYNLRCAVIKAPNWVRIVDPVTA